MTPARQSSDTFGAAVAGFERAAKVFVMVTYASAVVCLAAAMYVASL